MEPDPQNPTAAPNAITTESTAPKKIPNRKLLAVATWGGAILIVALFIFNFDNIRGHSVRAEDASYFTVASVTPESDSKDNVPDGPITITFTQPVDPSNLHGYFTINPMVPGTFTQGDSPEQVVFTPKFTLGEGTSVRIILNHGFRSQNGAMFASDYNYNFFTRFPDDSISFGANGEKVSTFLTALPGTQVPLQPYVGSETSPDWQLLVYKGSADELLKSLRYTNHANPDSTYVSKDFIGDLVDTSSFEKITSTTGVTGDAPYNFTQGPGIYYVQALSDGKDVGHVWINVTDQGLIARQDDQAVYLATQNTQTGETGQNMSVALYNLEGDASVIGNSSVRGSGVIPVIYPRSADLLVGKTDQGYVFVPLNVPLTEADKRVNSNLSRLGNIYLYTDKPTYKTSDEVQFAGIVRMDNDAQYSLPATGSTVHVWISSPEAETTTLIDMHVPVKGDGGFSGTFTVPEGVSNPDYPVAVLYAQLDGDATKAASLIPFTTFDVQNENKPGLITVQFDQSEYVQGVPVMVHITGRDASGNPLANQIITYDQYLMHYDPADPASVASFGTDWGKQSGDEGIVTLDAMGQAIVTLSPDTSGSDKALTLDAHTSLDGVEVLHGAKTVLVRQGDLELSFGASRGSYHDGDTTVTRIYARDMNGNSLADKELSYRIYTSDWNEDSSSYVEHDLFTGTATTDRSGLAVIRQPIRLADPTQGLYPSIDVSGSDSAGRRVSVSKGISIQIAGSPDYTYYYHVPTLSNFDVATDKQTYLVGDTAHLTITSPFDQNVWVTYVRGRVYHEEWIHLSVGDNQLDVPVTTEFTPSFDISFSYYRGGVFETEGLTLLADTPANKLEVTASSATSTRALALSVRDASGASVAARVSVAVVDESIFNLRETMASGDLFEHFFAPRTDTTTLSSTLFGVGTGGGCGGGSGEDYPYVPNLLGETVYWNPGLVTGASGTLNIPLPSLRTGKYHVIIRAWSGETQFGQTELTI